MVVEGEKDMAGVIGKYKKALLNKRTVLKEVKDKLTEEKCTTHGNLVTQYINIFLFVFVYVLIGLLLHAVVPQTEG